MTNVRRCSRTIYLDIAFLDGYQFFQQFLKLEYSDENLDFWTECEEFGKITDKKKALQKATIIYSIYVQDGGSKEVRR